MLLTHQLAIQRAMDYALTTGAAYTVWRLLPSGRFTVQPADMVPIHAGRAEKLDTCLPNGQRDIPVTLASEARQKFK
jgi:hypothetical protein